MSHIQSVAQQNAFGINVKVYGAVGDGTTDDTSAIQAAITANPGTAILLPKGNYKVTSTLHVAAQGCVMLGQLGRRYYHGGTEIRYYGTGPCFEIGTDDGTAWDSLNYNGLQSHRFENFYVVHMAPHTNLSMGGSFGQYKAGSYAFRDWRGGGLMMTNIGISNFEYGTWGIGSDINTYINLVTYFCHYGMYMGPRTDQQSVRDLYAVYCDSAVVIDGAMGVRFDDAQIVNCGTNTYYPVDIRKGSGSVSFNQGWFEASGGYAGGDGCAFFGIGVNNGGLAGGFTADTDAVLNVQIHDPIIMNYASDQPTHFKHFVDLGKATGVRIINPIHPQHSGYPATIHFDALVGVPAGMTFNAADAQGTIEGISSSATLAKIYENLGSGTPSVVTTFNGGVASAPASGTWCTGQSVYNRTPTAGGYVGWVCTAGGTPGTWKGYGVIGPSADVATDGPHDWFIPEIADDFDALGLATPDFLWLCDDASGDLVNSIGAATPLAPNATGHLYQQTVTGWSRKFVGTDGATVEQSWRTTDAALDLTSGQSCAIVCLASCATPAANTRVIMGISGGNDLLGLSAPGGLLRTGHAGIVVNGTVAQGGIDDVHIFVWYRNATTNVSGAVSSSDAVSGTHDEGARTGVVRGLGALSLTAGSGIPPNGRYGWFAVYLGANAEQDWAAYINTIKGV